VGLTERIVSYYSFINYSVIVYKEYKVVYYVTNTQATKGTQDD
jgi:hypothetical protein